MFSDSNFPSLEELTKVQTTRKMIAENIESVILADLLKTTVIRFSINTGKYILGLVKDVVQTVGEKKYEITYQKEAGMDKLTKKPLVSNEKV